MSRTGREPKQSKDDSNKGSRSTFAKKTEEKIKVNRQKAERKKLKAKKAQNTNKKKNGRKPSKKIVKNERKQKQKM